MNNKQMVINGIVGVILYAVSTGLSYAVFSGMAASPKPTPALTDPSTPANNTSHFQIDPSIPRTEACPINGKMYTKQEREVWEKRRPLAVMIENHADSRPQSGLSDADIVYEAVAEGGITRFMGVFHCGPVSAR